VTDTVIMVPVQDFDSVAVKDAGHIAGDDTGQSGPCEIEREREERDEATAYRVAW
jgi:hypothetical protein